MSDETILERIIERDEHATNQWAEIFKEAKIDQRYVGGDPWDPKDRLKRQNAGRPCLSLDELGQYYNQVINDVRANPRAMKFTPAGNGATDDTARFYTDHAREVEYRSNAQIAYTSAFESCIQQSMGWVRVYTDYEHVRSVNKNLCIGNIPNPLMVRADPDIQMPDASDMKYLLFAEQWKTKEFVRVFGKDAKVTSFGAEAAKQAPGWLSGDQIQLAEYWEIEAFKRQLLILTNPEASDPIGVFKDELGDKPLPDGYALAREEARDDTRVRSYLTNGLEILRRTEDWKGRYIPFASCFGKVLYVDEGDGAKRKILSMTRLARDAFMAYCFYRTSEIEIVGMTTKNPYWAYEAQLSNEQMVEIQKSLHEPVAVLLAKPTIPELPGQLMPLPTRNQFSADIAAFSVGAEEMRRAVQSAMGIAPLPTDAQRQNQKSGKALQRIESAGQRGSFHFKDAHDYMVRRVGVIFEDLVTPILDTARTVSVRDGQGAASPQRINDPRDPKSVSTKGDHLVTVSTGPAIESEREAASDFADTLAQISPEIFALLGPLIVKLKNLGPIGDEIADLLKMLQPPQVQAMQATKEQGPQQVAQQLLQAKGENQQLRERLQQAAQAIEAKLPELQAKIREAEIDARVKKEVAEIQAHATLGAATIKADQAHAVELLRLELESIRAIVDEVRADKDRAHELALQQHAQMHAGVTGERAHEQQLEMSDREAALADVDVEP